MSLSARHRVLFVDDDPGVLAGARRVMHFCATGAYVVAAGLIYRHKRTRAGALIGMAVGCVLQTLMMVPMNLIFTVHFFGVPKETVLALLPTAIIPFNAIKTVVNSLITFLLYKRVSKLFERNLLERQPQRTPQD